MSISCLKNLSVQFWRAYISTHIRSMPWPAHQPLRSCSNKNNLFQMVKKRTMEAQSKTQASKTIREVTQKEQIFSKPEKRSTPNLNCEPLFPKPEKRTTPNLNYEPIYAKPEKRPSSNVTCEPIISKPEKRSTSNVTCEPIISKPEKRPTSNVSCEPIYSKAEKRPTSIVSCENAGQLTPKPLPPKPLPPKPYKCQNKTLLDATDCGKKNINKRGGYEVRVSKAGSKGSSTETSDCPPVPEAKEDINITILDATDCGKTSSRSGGDDTDGTSKKGRRGGRGGGGGKSDGDGDDGGDDDRNRKLLLALLAALAAGGLLWWLLTRSKDKCEKEEVTTKKAVVPGVVPGKDVPAAASASKLPKHVQYLLIGGGTASFSAFRAIRSNDPKAKVLMITNENCRPYMRPPLSKEVWYSAKPGEIAPDYRFKQWTGAEKSIYFEPEKFFVSPQKLTESPKGSIAVAQGFTVKKIDPENQIVTLNDGCEIAYDKCLIATGCTPKTLPVFTNAHYSVKEKVMAYRTPEDFEKLKHLVDQNKSITIIGNDFIGSELASSLVNYSKDKGAKINQVFPETGNMSKVLPDYLSRWTTYKLMALGVNVLPNASIRDVRRNETSLELTLNNGQTLITDVAVVCVGCEPSIGLANASNLKVDKTFGGLVVNSELEASRNLFAAGDVCCFPDPILGRRRVQHYEHSLVSGRLAGENMVGAKKYYNHQSMFWSDLGPEIGYEGIGLVDACLPTVGVFALPSNKTERRTDNLSETIKEKGEKIKSTTNAPEVTCDPKDADRYGRGVIFYLKDDKIVGVLLWNLFNRIGIARTIINQDKKFEDISEVAKLFEIHS